MVDRIATLRKLSVLSSVMGLVPLLTCGPALSRNLILELEKLHSHLIRRKPTPCSPQWQSKRRTIVLPFVVRQKISLLRSLHILLEYWEHVSRLLHWTIVQNGN